MVLLLVQIWVFLPKSWYLIVLFILQVLNLAIFILEKSDQLVVFSDDALFAFFDNFEFLVVWLGEHLSLLNFLFPGFILQVPDFLLEGQLVGDEDVVKLFVLKAEFSFGIFGHFDSFL